MKFKEICARKGRETEKALELCFTEGVACFKEHWFWVPKSCYKEEMQGNYRIQLVAAWYYWENQLFRFHV